MKAISATDFLRLDGLKTNYIIPHILPEVGRIALCGVPKKGKSFLALQVAMAVCQGIPFLGHEVVKPGPVLYLQFDTPPELWQERLKTLAAAGVSIPDNLYFLRPDTQPRRANFLDGHQSHQIHDVLMQTLPCLVIVDVLSSVHHLKENEADDMKQVLSRINTLFQGRAYLLVHHTAKPNMQPGAGQQSANTAGRGSSYLGGEMDANWLLTSREKGKGRLSIEARFTAPFDDIALAQNQATGLWVASQPSDLQPKVASALHLIQEHPTLSYMECKALFIQAKGSESSFDRAWKMRQPSNEGKS